ncbi:LOW QUALITY PROTEIN: gustatory receptor-like 65a [Drosophila tropicalis]|uniref:LOW QUALITY PROTEIN: gustatory receptor-like 65a n=1 Tax=Drosophila tropicalis TaxID=46794 RepID=UPI0035AC123F
MKSLNLLNRCTRIFLRLTVLLTQIFGVTFFVYDKKQQLFRQSWKLGSYGFVIFVVMLLHVLYCGIYALQKFRSLPIVVIFMGCNLLVLVVRLHVLINNKKCLGLLNEMQDMLVKLQLMAKHPNIFRLSHSLLLLLTVQNFLRSLTGIYDIGPEHKLKITAIYLFITSTIMLTFLLQITINICLLIVLIACYDELRQSTKKISKAVHTLRQAQVLEGGQLFLLVEQLCGLTEDLISLRYQVHRLNVEIIKLFRFHWLCTFVYWLLPILLVPAVNRMVMYKHAISLMNIAFYCTIFEIFVWKSKLSKSFWHFHLINYHAEFDRTIERLFHQEIVQRIKVSIYGISLDMKFLFKIFSICETLKGQQQWATIPSNLEVEEVKTFLLTCF